MKLENRLMVKFLTGVVTLSLILIGLFLFFYYGAGMLKGGKQQPSNDPEAVMGRMASEATVSNDGRVEISSKMKEQLSRNQEWTQVLNGRGQEVMRYRAPKNVPVNYSPSDLVQLKKEMRRKGYNIHVWNKNHEKEEYTWILGRKNNYVLLRTLKDATQWKDGKIYVPTSLLRQVHKQRGWVQILDEKGREIYEFERPKDTVKNYTPGKFVYMDSSSLIYLTGKLNGKPVTWVYNHASEVNDQEKKTNLTIAALFFTSIIASLCVFVFFAYRFGRKLGEPLLLILRWIQDLSRGDYRGCIRAKYVRDPQTGQLKKRFRIYQEVMEALEKLSVQLNEVEEKRSRLDQSRDEWLAGVSHDLKTPLSTIKGYADLYAHREYRWSTAEMEHYLELVIQKTEYIQHLIEDMNITFQMKNEALSLNRERGDMKETLRMIVAEVLSEADVEESHIRLELPKDTHVMASVDPKWFKRAVINILTNAFVHNPPDTEVIVELKVETNVAPSSVDPGLRISIRDDGVGMDAKTVSTLFQRYYRGRSSINSSYGTGLGMAIAKKLIELHDGEISVRSHLNKGTEMTIELPSREIPAS
ncbi:Signal transduction histidine kinase [Marininema mesophilum]|uniref:histidine kinase n=1 Tax=Marininema mesophilum TaxID=1048340 RepID=A0A1H3AHC1_9BACL|nr:HAMP domain-containing sensor histidine kinase [Marininema mesophilum]SDX29076.1 Signal transduction histidine kinase [Marininema mesophilum]